MLSESPLQRRPGAALRTVREETAGTGSGSMSGFTSGPAKRVSERLETGEAGGATTMQAGFLPGVEKIQSRESEKGSRTSKQNPPLGGLSRSLGLSQAPEEKSPPRHGLPHGATTSRMRQTEALRNPRYSDAQGQDNAKSKRTTEVVAKAKRGSMMVDSQQHPIEQMEPSVAAVDAIMNNDRVILGNLLRNQHISTTTKIGDHALIAWAAEHCRPEMCRILLESSADVDGTDAAGRTALALGAGAGDVQVCELLIDHHANVARKDSQGHGPLHWAAYGGSDEACSLLLTSNASLNDVDSTGQTPLHTASRFGHAEVCELLLRQKAEANATDQQGQAPLHLATIWGFPHICALLLESGADRNLQRKDGAAATHLSRMPWI